MTVRDGTRNSLPQKRRDTLSADASTAMKGTLIHLKRLAIGLGVMFIILGFVWCLSNYPLCTLLAVGAPAASLVIYFIGWVLIEEWEDWES
jgi:hypothetical protein